MKETVDIKILLADDNPELADILREALSRAGYINLRAAFSVASAREQFRKYEPDLIILDINFPDGDGFSLFQEIRAQSDIPVLFLSARDADSDRLYGLGLGADDYLTKPFLMQELILRVQAILRRFYRAEPRRTEDFFLDSRQISLRDALITVQGQSVCLTATELAILRKLYENRGHIVTFDALCEAVWDDGYYGRENSLNVHIRHLREKIEENPSHPRWLFTVRGLGYKLRKEDKL